MPPCEWSIDPDGLCNGWGEFDSAVQSAALDLATEFMWGATGRRFGLCQVTIRPCQDVKTFRPAYQDYALRWPDRALAPFPFLDGGTWRNCGCGPRCCCRPECEIILRGPVHDIDSIQVDGAEVDPSAYRVDVSRGTYFLVRTDGTCWPTCQDFNVDAGEEGSFVVDYVRGRPLPGSLEVATAILACEYARGIAGQDCRLPKRVTSITRQGVTVDVEPESADEGLTGIPEVDQVITSLNPTRRTRPPVALSPDLPENGDRITINLGGS